MFHADDIRRLAEGVTPPTNAHARAKKSMMNRMKPAFFEEALKEASACPALKQRVDRRVKNALATPVAGALSDLISTVVPDAEVRHRLRRGILARLDVRSTIFHTSLKWTAAFAVFLLIVRFGLPLAFIAPDTYAVTVVQLVPQGDVSILVGGVWVPVTSPRAIDSAVLVRTGENAGATILYHDDGVFRLAEKSSARLHGTNDLPQAPSAPLLSLVRGDMWVLGLIPGYFEGIGVETPFGTAHIKEGSVGIRLDADKAVISVYDRSIEVQQGKAQEFLAVGERITLTGAERKIAAMTTQAFTTPWVSENLSQDSTYRTEIAKLQEERRTKIAGILPTSRFYPLKLAAEKVDLLFTINKDTVTQKKFVIAETRLSEAAELLKMNQVQEATFPLTAYRETLLELATGTGDNLVRFLINKQIADASVSVTTVTPDTQLYILKEAVFAVSEDLPNTFLNQQEVKWYVLVDKLSALYRSLKNSGDLAQATVSYQELQPYLQEMFADETVTSSLKKEAEALLIQTATLLEEKAVEADDTARIAAVQEDLQQYLPPEPEQEKVLVTAAKIDARVAEMVERILLYKFPTSRYNQLLTEMRDIENDPYRGTLLRNLQHALPKTLGEYVKTGIVEFSEELKAKNNTL